MCTVQPDETSEVLGRVQIILELLELREVDVARALLRQTECMLTMKQEQPERHMRLEALASRPIWDAREACKSMKRPLILNRARVWWPRAWLAATHTQKTGCTVCAVRKPVMASKTNRTKSRADKSSRRAARGPSRGRPRHRRAQNVKSSHASDLARDACRQMTAAPPRSRGAQNWPRCFPQKLLSSRPRASSS